MNRFTIFIERLLFGRSSADLYLPVAPILAARKAREEQREQKLPAPRTQPEPVTVRALPGPEMDPDFEPEALDPELMV